MRSCSNPKCTVPNPQEESAFYTGKARCKSCLKKYQRAYNLTDACKASHFKYRTSEKGLKTRIAIYKRYGKTRKGRARARDAQARRHLNRHTLALGFMFTQCGSCVELTDSGCNVIEGAEDIDACEVILEARHSGVHPLSTANWDDDCPYDPVHY